MSREDLIRKVAAVHDTHLAYEAPESSVGSILFNKDLDSNLIDDLAGYVLCNLTVGELRTWLLRDRAPMRLGAAYQQPPSP